MENTLDYSEKKKAPYQDIPDGLKIVFFILLMLIFGTLFSILGYLILGVYYQLPLFPIDNLFSSLGNNTNAEIVIQLFSATGAFIIPALVYGKLFEAKPIVFFKTSKKPKLKIILFTIVIFILANFVLDLLVKASHLVPFETFDSPFIQSILEIEKLTAETFKRFLDFNSPLNFLAVFLMMAVVPAIGEELTFRGVFFNVFKRSSKNLIFAVLFSGFIFALIHFQLHNFLAIFFMGSLLAYIYYITENLWVSIIAHLFNNGMIVVLTYANKLGLMNYDFSETDDMPILVSIFGAIIFFVSFYFYRNEILKDKQTI